MASTRDLVAAHVFTRERLVTAFVTGRCRNTGADPPRTGRAIAAGAAITVLMLGGAAIAERHPLLADDQERRHGVAGP